MSSPSPKTRAVRLTEPGWTPQVRQGLEQLVRRGAGRHLPVVFDFDNTIVCGDIGEATLAVLVRDGILKAAAIPEALCPAFRLPDGRVVNARACGDLTEYYELYLAPTAHGAKDPTPLANGYVWAVEAMTGLSLRQVVAGAQAAYGVSHPGETRIIEVTPGRTSYPAPWFYPEMIELIALLLRREFDVWIVSASNVWSVRWMVQHGLNPLLKERGLARGIPPERVVGVSTLLVDDKGRLHKDGVLVREDKSYATLADSALSRFRLTNRLHYPVPTYSGKVACLWDALGRRPFLCAGDSPGDHPMLTFGENRLWIARVEKPDYLRATLRLRRDCRDGAWLFQPTRCKSSPGFLSDASLCQQKQPHRGESH